MKFRIGQKVTYKENGQDYEVDSAHVDVKGASYQISNERSRRSFVPEADLSPTTVFKAGDWMSYCFGGDNYIRKVVEVRLNGFSEEQVKLDTNHYFIPVPSGATKSGAKPTFSSGTKVWTKDGKVSAAVRSTVWFNGVEEVYCLGVIGNVRADTLTATDPAPRFKVGDWVSYPSLAGAMSFTRKVDATTFDGKLRFEGVGPSFIYVPDGAQIAFMRPRFENGAKVWDGAGQEWTVTCTYWLDEEERVSASRGPLGIATFSALTLSAKNPKEPVLTAGDWVGYSYGERSPAEFCQFIRKVERVCEDGSIYVEHGGRLDLPKGWAKVNLRPRYENGQRVWDREGSELSVRHTYWFEGAEWAALSNGCSVRVPDLSDKAPEAPVKIGTAVKHSGYYAMVIEHKDGKYVLRFTDGSEMKNVSRSQFEPCPPVKLTAPSLKAAVNDSGRPILAGETFEVVLKDPTFNSAWYTSMRPYYLSSDYVWRFR